MRDDFKQLGEEARDAMVAFADDCSSLRWKARLIKAASVAQEALDTQERAEDLQELREAGERLKQATQSTTDEEKKALHDRWKALAEEKAERRRMLAAWKELPREQQEQAALALVGAGGLTISEMLANAKQQDPIPLISVVFYNDGIRALLNEMAAAGLARREGEGGSRGYRWWPVVQPLQGLIADIERQFKNEGKEDR
jgi:hypothetical protein